MLAMTCSSCGPLASPEYLARTLWRRCLCLTGCRGAAHALRGSTARVRESAHDVQDSHHSGILASVLLTGWWDLRNRNSQPWLPGQVSTTTGQAGLTRYRWSSSQLQPRCKKLAPSGPALLDNLRDSSMR